MCGRYTLISNPEAIRRLFELPAFDERLVPPRYNIAPTQPIAIVRRGHRGRELIPVRWGFIPAWAKDPRDVPLLINARAEGLADKASFRAALRYRRCLVPASGFYEWRRLGKRSRQPFAVRPGNGTLLAFAGLWETYCGHDGSEIDTAAIITVPCNEGLSPVHDRMPAIIDPGDFAVWLAAETEVEQALDLLRPAPEELLTCAPVSNRVNSAAEDDEGLWVALPEPLPGPEAEPPAPREAQPRQPDLF